MVTFVAGSVLWRVASRERALVAPFAADVDRLEALIDRADQAMYQSKRAGRNRVTRWAASLGEAPTTAAV